MRLNKDDNAAAPWEPRQSLDKKSCRLSRTYGQMKRARLQRIGLP